jgi:predicted NUDIX family NTP pyrophosphohydrolase
VIEWPLRSGSHLEIAEVDCGQWFSVTEARRRVRSEQENLLIRLGKSLGMARIEMPMTRTCMTWNNGVARPVDADFHLS